MLNFSSIMIGTPQPKVMAEFYEKYIRSFYSDDITHHVLKERGWTLIDSNREINVVVKEIIDIIHSYGIR